MTQQTSAPTPTPTQESPTQQAKAEPQKQPATVKSASDKRVVNNVMRHEYRVLSDVEKKNMQDVKDAGLALWNAIDKNAKNDILMPLTQHFKSILSGMTKAAGKETRELAIAKRRLAESFHTFGAEDAKIQVEEAVMWTVKHITR